MEQMPEADEHSREFTPPTKPNKPESWLGMFQSEGKIVGDIISPAINKNQWEVLTNKTFAGTCRQIPGRKIKISHRPTQTHTEKSKNK